MTFNSIFFLLYFLPISLLVYYTVPPRLKNFAFLAESVIFYWWAAPTFLPLIAVLICINYVAAIVQRKVKTWVKKKICVSAVGVTLLSLILFKYFDFICLIAETISLTGFGSLRFFDALPMGISYYTFKLISYQIDVYTGKTEAENNFVNFAMYTVWFPQIPVGPIIRYTHLREGIQQPKDRCTFEKCAKGVQLFIVGLAQKEILADGIGALWDEVSDGRIGLSQASTPLVWLAVAAYSLELYFDFSGFSNMSNGLSYMFGFACRDNFRSPYISRSITEFWTRWHISLSEWFRDYIYIPLGGNRKGWRRQVLNLLVVWLLTGIWHITQRNLNFILWGIYYFLILLLEKKMLKPHLEKGAVWPHLYTLLVVVIGWGIFACTSENVTVPILFSGLFGFSDGVSALYFIRNYGVLFIVCILFSTPLPEKIWRGSRKIPFLQPFFLTILLVLSIAYVVTGTATTALYIGF